MEGSDVDDFTSSLPNTGPHLYLFLKKGKFEMAVIGGDQQTIDGQSYDI